MSAKGNCTKQSDGTIVYKAVSKSGSPPGELDSSKWYMDKCEIVGYRAEHLTIKVNQDGIIRVDGNYNDGRASRSFFNEYIIPDGVNHERLEFGIYEADANTLVILGAIGGELVSAQQSSTITRTEDVRISSTFTETFESTELEGSEDISKEVRIVDNKFEAKVNVSEYRSEEIQVRISRKVVLITTRKEVTKTSNRQEIKKTFEIPAGVAPESITSVVGKDGNLTVTAKVDQELAKQQRQMVEQKQQTNTDEVLIRVRTVNTTKSVTGDDLKDVKINKDRFEMNVDLREYKLEEITVKIIKSRRIITISANHKSQFESRSNYREFTLPAGAPDSNPNAIDAVLSPNGIVTITGPCSPQVCSPAALTNINEDAINKVVQQQNTAVQQQHQQNTSVQQQQTTVQQKNTSVQQNASVQQQNTSVQQQNTSVQQHHKNTSVQQVQDSTVQQHQSQQEIVQQTRYTKITRATFTSSTMTSLDIAEANEDSGEPLVSEPSTPIEDVTQDMVEDEDGNFVVELNIKDYRPEEISIKASKTTITVVGRKTDTNEEFCKTVRVPVGVVVTPDKIRSILDKSRRVITIIITKKVTTTTTEEQIREQERQQVQKKQETLQENQTKVQTQQQINQQKQVQQKQQSIEETQTEVQTQQRINQQRQVQQKQESIESTETEIQTQQRINQQRQLQQKQDSIRETDVRTQQLTDQQKQIQQKLDQRQQNTTTATTTSKRTLKTTTTTVETLKTLGYNFDSATSQEYTGDPKFFERSTQIVDYKPEELEVKIAMPWVIIEGKQEMTAENGWRSKQFTKMFTVPEGVKQENILLEMNEAGDVVNCTAKIG